MFPRIKEIFLLSLLLTSSPASDRALLKNAQQAAHWLQSCVRQTKDGKVWPADPRDSTTVSTNLYSGSSGVVLFFLEMYRATKNEVYLNEARTGADYLDFAKSMTADLLKRAAREGDGIKWFQAEHRVRPELLFAQTGYMQGTAGIGMLLLHLDALEQGRTGWIVLPDSPFN